MRRKSSQQLPNNTHPNRPLDVCRGPSLSLQSQIATAMGDKKIVGSFSISKRVSPHLSTALASHVCLCLTDLNLVPKHNYQFPSGCSVTLPPVRQGIYNGLRRGWFWHFLALEGAQFLQRTPDLTQM